MKHLLLPVLLAACVLQINGQAALQVVNAGLYNQTVVANNSASPRSAGLQAAPSAEVTFWQPGVTLPLCPNSQILQTDQGIPANWASLGAMQQVTSPAIPLILQLSYAAWRDDVVRSDMGTCLERMGISLDSVKQIDAKVPPYGGTMTALVMRAGTTAVFVSFRGTDFEDPGDILVDADCAHTPNLRRLFTSATRGDVRLHKGFYKAWNVLEAEVSGALEAELAKVEDKNVYFIGHSLGASIAAIGALRMNYLWASTPNQVAGVFLFGCPRIGNTYWQRLYHQQLLTRTLRVANYGDFASRLPMQKQVCPLTNMNGTFTFSHIGRSLVLCPDALTGLVDWRYSPGGSEELQCGILPEVDLSVKTHWLGSYLDAWRRGVAQATGENLARSPQLANVICSECGDVYSDQNKMLNQPARAGGPIGCSTNANCNRRGAWDVAATVGSTYMKGYSLFTVCFGYMCT